MKVVPLNGNVLIEVVKTDKTKSGILLSVQDNLISEQAKIIAVSPESTLKAGQQIFFKSYAMDTIEIDDKPYHFLKEDQILGVKK